ncbi:MAG: haloacid dehalogenase, partial [Desulfobacterota bacterium]|nr:haloacid dehalogenase [Thermodesulfobacteriota bacterium]
RLFVRMARENYNYDINYDDITDYEFLKCIRMDRQHALEIIEVLTHDPHEVDLFPNYGADSVLIRMSSLSPLLVVTARPLSDPVALWFKRHIPQIDRRCIKVEATGVNTAKLEVLKGNSITHFVDDRLDTCHMLQEAGITPIVFTQPWNRRPHPFHAVNTWEEIATLIDWNGASQQGPPCAEVME